MGAEEVTRSGEVRVEREVHVSCGLVMMTMLMMMVLQRTTSPRLAVALLDKRAEMPCSCQLLVPKVIVIISNLL